MEPVGSFLYDDCVLALGKKVLRATRLPRPVVANARDNPGRERIARVAAEHDAEQRSGASA